jgi:hypothetical protein
MKRILVALALGLGLASLIACKKSEANAAGSSAPAPAAEASSPAAKEKPGLVTDKALVDGRMTEIVHSKWDGGQTADLFDGKADTLARTENANPAVIELHAPAPRPLKGISITTGSMDLGVTVVVKPQGAAAKTYTKEFRNMPPDPTVNLDFDTGKAPIESVRVEIKNLNGGDGHIHIRAIQLL